MVVKNRPAESASGAVGSLAALLIWLGIDPVLAGALVLVAGFVPGAVTWALVTWRTAGKDA